MSAGTSGTAPEHHVAGGAVDRDHLAGPYDVTAELKRARVRVDARGLEARDARLAHAARHDRRVGRHAAVRGQHPLRLDEPVDVVGRRLPANEHDRLARPAAPLRLVGAEHRCADRRPWRGVQAARDGLDRRRGIDARMQQLIELGRVDPPQCLVAVDRALLDELACDAQRGRSGALAGARLQDVERSALDGELDVLHLAVMRLELIDRLHELGVDLWHQLVHALDRLGRADARDHVLALGVEQELAEQPALAGGRVAREADAGAGVLAHVAEHHLAHVRGRAVVVRDPVRAAVDTGARRIPRAEDRVDGEAQLLARILWERVPGVGPVEPPELVDDAAQAVGVELDVAR